MINQLLKIKQHREQSLRLTLVRIQASKKSLLEEKVRLHNEHRLLRATWSDSSRQSEVFDQSDFQVKKKELQQYYQHDLTIADQLVTLRDKLHELELLKAENEALLREVMRRQEKLKYLLEHSDGDL